MTQHAPPSHGVRRPRNPLSILARWLGRHETLMRLAPAIIWLESRLRSWTNNRVSLVGIAGLASLQLTVPGRKTGLPRTTALLCVPLGDSYIVTGSNWGRPKNPVWSVNLLAAHEAEVKLGAVSRRMSVRPLAGQERDRLWEGIVHYWPGYEMELRIAGGREFRMFMLEPLTSTDLGPDTLDEDGLRSA
ncbi:nitroreductase family deazaflavin-dependent oxidoreductase [Tomitella biformata]|uniref:nitroreductase family deazaflavin-dependent oxidoreductase n=1 Tax=Tomitella biformata TaxID=630403 RepID=UPI0004677E33|nr:nitroreductase family deazaflavin-dependent oxidoreductase [Tomitella biformata]